MNAQLSTHTLFVFFALALLSPIGTMANPEARQCTPLTAPASWETEGRTVISGPPWTPTSGGEKVIYGTDDRKDVYQETNPARRALAGSVCALLYTSELTPLGGGGWHIDTVAYRYEGLPPCAGEPFASQPIAPHCTGFLVGPDLVATAGHCYNASSLAGVRFVFGFEMQDAATPELDVAEDQVYAGIEVVGRQLTGTPDLDYAVIRLDRAVTAPGAVPLAIRRSGTVPVATAVGVIGYPSGLPKKIAFGTATRVTESIASGYFKANVDTYGGNSGSPVFNAATGVVEGILVRGNDDFLKTPTCFYSNTLPGSTIAAEQVSRATTFESFIPELPGSSEISLDREVYACTATVGLTLTDPNASGATLQAAVSSGTGDTETVTLAETAAGSRVYTASLPLTAAAAIAQNGTLSVSDGTEITALYSDPDNGLGAPEDVTATAPVDCAPPVISEVTFSGLSGTFESASFKTNEEATGTLAYSAVGCHDAGAALVSTAAGTSHTTTLTGLVPSTPYFVSITATDPAGNSAVSDNGGACHGFTTAADPVADGGFELGTPNPAWDEDSTAYGSVICSEPLCGLGNTGGPSEGDWWSWFGGVEGAAEDGFAEQSVVIPPAVSALLTFQLQIPAAHVPGYLRVLMDGTQVFQATEADSSAYAAFKTVMISVSAYADGMPHTLRFEGHTNGTGLTGVTNFFVDQVGIAPSDEGEPVVQVTVPGVVGLAQSAAMSTLQTAGLAAQVTAQACSDVFAEGQILSQTPATGSSALQGSTVTLTVSTGDCPVEEGEGEGEPTPLTEAAQALLDNFDDADTNQDGALSIAEAQAAQPGLAAGDFMTLDTSDDGLLSQDELAAYLGADPACGCACNKSGLTPGGLQKSLGDLFLAGLGLAVLLVAGRLDR